VASVLASSLSVLCVIAASLPAPPPPRLELGVAPGTEADYEAAIAAVEEANLAVNNDPEANLAALEAAIEQLGGFGPQIAASANGREALDLSLLNLARALLLTGDEARAAEVMDEVIRAAHGRKLPTKKFGPTLVKFHDQRRAQLEQQGTAAIQVLCRVSCRVVIDARPATTDSGPLYLGTHRVWVEAANNDEAPLELDVELDVAGATAVVHYPAEETTCEAEPVIIELPPPPAPPQRILPRWTEISVIAIGVGAVIAGGVMLGLDGKCPGGLDPIADAQRCPELYEGTASGLTAIGIGSALLVAGAVTLSIDEVRVGNERGRQAVLGWTMRF
jgi:hypothetical protein